MKDIDCLRSVFISNLNNSHMFSFSITLEGKFWKRYWYHCSRCSLSNLLTFTGCCGIFVSWSAFDSWAHSKFRGSCTCVFFSSLESLILKRVCQGLQMPTRESAAAATAVGDVSVVCVCVCVCVLLFFIFLLIFFFYWTFFLSLFPTLSHGLWIWKAGTRLHRSS